jgi:ribosome-associated translation inhibitor RaiA
MQIQINTHNHVEGHERMEAYFSETIANALKRFEDKITRIEVHINDENGEKFGEKRCIIETRIAGMSPIAATNHSDTTEKAVAGAIDKMKHLLTTTFDKMKSH